MQNIQSIVVAFILVSMTNAEIVKIIISFLTYYSFLTWYSFGDNIFFIAVITDYSEIIFLDLAIALISIARVLDLPLFWLGLDNIKTFYLSNSFYWKSWYSQNAKNLGLKFL